MPKLLHLCLRQVVLSISIASLLSASIIITSVSVIGFPTFAQEASAERAWRSYVRP